jgi:hypothetical protein
MPKVAINEYRDLPRSNHEIWPPHDIERVEPVAQSSSVKLATKSKLGL